MNRRAFLFSAPTAVVTAAVASAQTASVTLEEIHEVFEQRSVDIRREAQLALRSAGYYEGTIDGAWGPETADAYRQLMRSDRYKRNVSHWTWTHKVQVIETVFFLNSDAYP